MSLRKYIQHNGKWREVYIINTMIQLTIGNTGVKMVEYKLTEKSKTTYLAPRDKFHNDKPRKINDIA